MVLITHGSSMLCIWSWELQGQFVVLDQRGVNQSPYQQIATNQQNFCRYTLINASTGALTGARASEHI
jgi:hypothetical protein